jgi:putative serine/threonine protein kinase
MIPLAELHSEKYGKVLCYPRFNEKDLESRIEELERLKVKGIEFSGQKKVGELNVLGKGCVGIVTVAYTDFGKAALKIRRVDADRSSMTHEAEMLKIANSIGIGPKLYGVTKNFMLMEFIDGQLLPSWIEGLKGRGRKKRVKAVLAKLLRSCFNMDMIGLDHGELSRAPKHVIVDSNDNPRIVDFETASNIRKAANVTSICQFLFIGSETSKKIKNIIGKVNVKSLIGSLKKYKSKPAEKNFIDILKICGLTEGEGQ